MGERDFSQEYVFQELANSIRSTLPGWEAYSPDGLPFSDKGISGKTHTLTVKETLQGGNGRNLAHYNQMNREFKIFSISKAYYDYLVSVLCCNADDSIGSSMIDLGISDPTKIANNIDGGIGVFGTYSLASQKMDVIAIIGKFSQ
jgi:hypothetical protein